MSLFPNPYLTPDGTVISFVTVYDLAKRTEENDTAYDAYRLKANEQMWKPLEIQRPFAILTISADQQGHPLALWGFNHYETSTDYPQEKYLLPGIYYHNILS
jgi:hypothetical protein